MTHKHLSKDRIKIQNKKNTQLVVIKRQQNKNIKHVQEKRIPEKHTQEKHAPEKHAPEKHIRERHVIQHNKPYKYIEDDTEYDSPEFPLK